jgi:hypothetical protein
MFDLHSGSTLLLYIQRVAFMMLACYAINSRILCGDESKTRFRSGESTIITPVEYTSTEPQGSASVILKCETNSIHLPLRHTFPGRESIGNVKVKQSCYRPELAQRVGRGIAIPFRDLGTRRGCVVSITPRPLYPVPTVQEAGWAQGRSGRVRKISPPPGVFFLLSLSLFILCVIVLVLDFQCSFCIVLQCS